MTCKYCGNEIDDGSDVCFVCGQKIAGEPETEEPAQDAPAEADAQPIPVSEPADPEEYADVEPADVEKAGKFARFISFVFPLIGWFIYASHRKHGRTGKMNSIANAAWSGVCFYLAIAIVIVVKSSMF